MPAEMSSTAQSTQTYYIALMSVTGPTALTQFARFDERYDVPMVDDIERAQCYRSWLDSVEKPTEQQWQAFQKNWISYLSATSVRPNGDLAPERPTRGLKGEQSSTEQPSTKRFETDSRYRAAIQVALYSVFDENERMASAWPSKARLALNRACNKTETEPFRTLAPKHEMAKQRRYQGIWASLVGFLVYAWIRGGMLEEMGLSLREDKGIELCIIKVIQGLESGVMKYVEEAVSFLCVALLTDYASNALQDPLLWWVTILVRSAVDHSRRDDYIGRGRFIMNVIPMDLSLRERLEAIQYYAKVTVLSSALRGSETLKLRWKIEINRDLATWRTGRRDVDCDEQQVDEEDQRSCSSPAWRAMLEDLRHTSTVLLSHRKDIDTVLGVVQKLLGRDMG